MFRALFFAICFWFAHPAKAQYLAPASDSAGSPGFSWSGDLTTGIFRPSAGSVAIGTTGLERLRINSNGVGIGTTTPARLLNVAGAIRLNPTTTPASPAAGDFFIDSAASNTLKFHNGTSWVSVGAGVSGDVLIGGNTVGSIMTIGTNSAHSLALETGSVTAVTIDTSGNVGIGTTNPGASLQVEGSARIKDSLAIQRSLGSAYLTTMSFSDTLGGARSDNLSIGNNGGADLLLHTNGSERLRILGSNGNVGIGTTAPAQRLSVVASGPSASQIQFGSTANEGGFLTSTSSSQAILSGGMYWNGTNWIAANASSSGISLGNGRLDFTSDTGNTIGNTQVTTTRMSIIPGGNVGIGTTAPSEKLEVASSTAGAALKISGSGAGYTASSLILESKGAADYRGQGIFMMDTLGGQEWYAGTPYTDTDKFIIARSTAGGGSHADGVAQNSNALFTINNAGNVGIGTTSPYSMLNIHNSGTTKWALLTFSNAVTGASDAANGGFIGFGMNVDVFYVGSRENAPVSFWANNSEKMRIAADGNVGIGTMPGAGTRLRVEGQISAKSLSGSSGAIDWANGNSQSTSYNCAANLTFASLRDGGSYTLAVTSTNTTQCSFSTSVTGDDAATVTYRFLPANSTRTATSHTIYSLQRIGTVVYVSWITGF